VLQERIDMRVAPPSAFARNTWKDKALVREKFLRGF
jgi:hypothetical protein